MKTLIKKAQNISRKLPIIKIFSYKPKSHNFGDIKDKKRGIGEEFWDFREYQLGDPLKSIDWKKSSKLNKILIKNNENESSKNIWFWINDSVSMNYKNSSKIEDKSSRSKILGLILIDIFLRSGEKVGIIGSDLSIKKGPKSFISIAKEFTSKSFKIRDSRIKRNDIVFIISDFLEKPDHIKTQLLNISDNTYSGILIQVLDSSELEFPFKGRKQFFDPLSGLHKIFNKSESMRIKYKEKINKHQIRLNRLCSKFGWKIFRNKTSQTYESLIIQIYNSL
ncbi:DUF58 domain-containing protein [Rickettsiales bacterium]|nr:DUF58 domain-containing protein [Rickettsiales bacterium]